MGYPGQRPRTGQGSLGRHGAQVEGTGQRRGVKLTDGRCFRQPDAADRVLGRIEPPQQGQRVAFGLRVPARQLGGGSFRARDGAGPEYAQRHQEQRSGWFERRFGQAFGRRDLESGRRVQSPADPSFGD